MVQQVSLRFAPYMGTASEKREVPAMVRGDLAVHRPAWIKPPNEGGALSTFTKAWTVSHIPTGDRVESAMPARFKDRGAITATRSQLLAWAEAWQAACPEFFAATREDRVPSIELCRDALDKGRAL